MTGTEIIAAARVAFGERTALTLTSDEIDEILKSVVAELYTWLDPSENPGSLASAALSLTNGFAAVDDSWDQILEVEEGNVPYLRVDRSTINNADINTYFAPGVPVWHFDGESLFVRPSVASVDVTYTKFTPVTDVTAEVSQVPKRYHPALVNLVAAYAYAQEEDLEQAGAYRSMAQEQVQSRRPAQEASAS